MFTSFSVHHRFAGIALVLALLIPATWGMLQVAQDQLGRDGAVRQAEVREDALAHVHTSFRAMQAGMQHEAEILGSHPVVQGILEAIQTTGSLASIQAEQDQAIRFFDGLDVPARTAIELYTPTLELVAWNGFSIQLSPSITAAPSNLRTVIAEDDYRKAVALWLPVRVEGAVAGVIRVVRLVNVRTPVQTAYLRNYEVDYRWRLQTGADLQALFGSAMPPPAAAVTQVSVPLEGLDGSTLGVLQLAVPSVDVLRQGSVRRYRNVMALWAVLLACWLFAGLWTLYRHRARRSSGGAGVRWAYFFLLMLGWWGLRYLLLLLDVPVRWFADGSPGAFLFDPADLASTLGGGFARSVGDLLLSALFCLGFVWAGCDFVITQTIGWARLARLHDHPMKQPAGPAQPLLFMGGLALASLAILGCIGGFGLIIRRVMLDSTLDYFAWTGLWPEPLVLIVFATLLIGTLSLLLLGMALYWVTTWFLRRSYPANQLWIMQAGGVLLVWGLPLVVVYFVFGLSEWVPWWLSLGVLALTLGGAWYGVPALGRPSRLFSARLILLGVAVTTALLYPLVYEGMDTQRRLRVMDAAEEFAAYSDEELLSLTELVLQKKQQEAGSSPASAADTLEANWLDPFLRTFQVRWAHFDTTGTLVQAAAGQPEPSISPAVFARLRASYAEMEASRPGALIRPSLESRDAGQTTYEGIAPVYAEASGQRTGWVVVRVTQRAPSFTLPENNGSTSWVRQLSLAEFRNRLLVRSAGERFERLTLPAQIAEDMRTRPEGWYEEVLHDRSYDTFYRVHHPQASSTELHAFLTRRQPSVIAARARAIIPYDHLYYILRIAVAGVAVGVVFFLLGLLLHGRIRKDQRQSFSERVQKAFLVVGVIAVVSMGLIGQEVVMRENQGAIQSRLERRLQRVENALRLEAQEGEALYQVLDRISIDALSDQLSLDLNVYEGATLMMSSRSPDATRRLVERRLPVAAYEALYLQGFEQAFVEIVGQREFPYTIGFKALPDRQGTPKRVIAVLTIPEQERIREERARTTAYLFGALLVLLFVVMVTATLLANALARPMRKLRDALEAVAAGRFQQPLPVESEDEVGELTRSFNTMQSQLADSRRQLARQERELAWREMARQVAHEIKNPLTPMKLSIQHLQRAYAMESDHEPLPTGRFRQLFQRITTTLTEQIEALVRIANEFSTFARLPTRHPETLDLNAAIAEAVALLQEEAGADIQLDLAEDPLVIEADREELRRLYINLIKNALQAMPDGGQVRVRTRPRAVGSTNGTPDMAYSEVIDTGSGIPVEVRENIFEPNFSTKTSGMGLGLAIVKKTIEDMKSEIGFETEEGKGTTFWVQIPLIEL